MERRTDERPAWFPFASVEVEVALGGFGVLATTLALSGVEQGRILAAVLTYVAFAYLAGLLVHAQRGRLRFRFIRDGALQGRGYARSFRRARHSLLLMHLDDDEPCQELQAVYRDLLDKGVQLRRVVFAREESTQDGRRWIVEFGDHQNLYQRLVAPEHSRMTGLSFAVVDEREVIVALPSAYAADSRGYRPDLRLRHLVVIDEAEIAAPFVRLHGETWDLALPIEDVGSLSSSD